MKARMVFFSVIIATLGPSRRPSLRRALDCLRRQTFRDFEVITDDSGPNEYRARNLAAERARGKVLAFTDDDCEPPPDWLESAHRHFASNPDLKYLTGPVEGDLWGWGRRVRVSVPYWSMGANMFVDREAFEELGGFDWSWGLSPPPRGWRSDSKLMSDFLEKCGRGGYEHAEDVVMIHPGPMQSAWDPRVEAEFYKRCRKYALRYIAPYDPRLCWFVASSGLEGDPKVLRYLTHEQKPPLDLIRREVHMLDYELKGEVRILDASGDDGFLFAGTGWDCAALDGGWSRVPWPVDDDSFDAVVLFGALDRAEDPGAVLREAVRASRRAVLIAMPGDRGRAERLMAPYNPEIEEVAVNGRSWAVAKIRKAGVPRGAEEV